MPVGGGGRGGAGGQNPLPVVRAGPAPEVFGGADKKLFPPGGGRREVSHRLDLKVDSQQSAGDQAGNCEAVSGSQ